MRDNTLHMPDPGSLTLSQQPRIDVLMAVYNGGAHLAEQLDSLAAQTHVNWHLYASDDNSADNSRSVLEAFAETHPVTILDGPGQGGAANFLSLLARLDCPLEEDCWIAFADQDDIWLPEKLERALELLRKRHWDRPALYCSRTWIADADGNKQRISAPRARHPDFRNALVQNIVAGNTTLLNPAAARLVREAVKEAGTVVVHDWWIYQVVTAAGGEVIHDDEPTLLYRQHAANQIGANDGTRSRLKRIKMILNGGFREWNAINVAALERSAHRFHPDHRKTLERFADMRRSGFAKRLYKLSRLGVYRQTTSATLALWMAALLNRL